MIKHISVEKEYQLKEAMKIMGLSKKIELSILRITQLHLSRFLAALACLVREVLHLHVFNRHTDCNHAES